MRDSDSWGRDELEEWRRLGEFPRLKMTALLPDNEGDYHITQRENLFILAPNVEILFAADCGGGYYPEVKENYIHCGYAPPLSLASIRKLSLNDLPPVSGRTPHGLFPS